MGEKKLLAKNAIIIIRAHSLSHFALFSPNVPYIFYVTVFVGAPKWDKQRSLLLYSTERNM